MNVRVGGSRAQQVGCPFLLTPPSPIQQDLQTWVSDGIFLGVGGRPVSGPEQEVTDTNGPEEGQMVWLARAQSGQARPSQPWGQERTKVQVESGY